MTGTPADSREANVVAKRANATLWVSGPKTGGRSLNASHFSLPFGVAIHLLIRTTIRMMAPMTASSQKLATTLEMAMTILVGNRQASVQARRTVS